MKKKGAGEGGVEGSLPAIKPKQLTTPPSMTEIRAPMLPTLKKPGRKDIEIDAYTNPFKTKLIAVEDEEDPYPIIHESYFNRGDESPKVMRKKKKKRVRHVDLIDEEEDNLEEQNRFFNTNLNDKAHQQRLRSQSHYSRAMPSPNQIVMTYNYP